MNAYERRIAELMNTIQNMRLELEQIQEILGEDVIDRAIDQKANWVVKKSTDLGNYTVKKPVYSITQNEASKVVDAVTCKLKSRNISSNVWLEYNTEKECYEVCMRADE